MPGSRENRGWTSDIRLQVHCFRHHSCASRLASAAGTLGIASCQAKPCAWPPVTWSGSAGWAKVAEEAAGGAEGGR